MGDEIPDSEKLAIATHFLLSSPPGEIKEVLADVKMCLDPPSLLNDSTLSAVFQKYNRSTFEVVGDADKKTTVLICEHGEVAANQYLDPKTGNVVEVDHARQTIVNAAVETKERGPNEAARAEVEAALEGYVAKQFTADNLASAVYETDAGALVAVLSGTKTNLRNYWSGRWRSEWTIDPKAKKVTEAKVRVLIHYFEDGNVQTSVKKDLKAGALKGGLGEGFVSHLREQEGEVHATLESLYQNMSNETFKDMRRILPLTKTKFDWSGMKTKLAGAAGQKKGGK